MIYLAVPYTGMEAQSFAAVNRYAGMLMQEGHHVFSPISMCHPMRLVCDLPGTFDYWQSFDTTVIGWCNALVVLMLRGWTKSTGVREEVKIAQAKGIPIYYRYPYSGPSKIEVINE